MDSEQILVWAVVLGLIPGMIASSKVSANKFGIFVLWWIYGAALFIIALPHSILWKPGRGATEDQALDDGLRKCPHCADMVPAEATVCRSCGRQLPELTVKVLDRNKNVVGHGRRHGLTADGETVILVDRRTFDAAAYAQDSEGRIADVVFRKMR